MILSLYRLLEIQILKYCDQIWYPHFKTGGKTVGERKEPKANACVGAFSGRKPWILRKALLYIQKKQGGESCKSKLLIRLFVCLFLFTTATTRTNYWGKLWNNQLYSVGPIEECLIKHNTLAVVVNQIRWPILNHHTLLKISFLQLDL